MDSNPLIPTANELGWMLLDGVLMVAAVILVVRIVGLRSFAKMSSFDFAVTVATGSILASVVLGTDRSFVHGLIALATMLGVQALISMGRQVSDGFQAVVDNEPLLLMDGPNILDANLKAGRVARDDLFTKLREANVLKLSQVRAVVLETTGDISVLHGDPDGTPLEDDLLRGVRRTP